MPPVPALNPYTRAPFAPPIPVKPEFKVDVSLGLREDSARDGTLQGEAVRTLSWTISALFLPAGPRNRNFLLYTFPYPALVVAARFIMSTSATVNIAVVTLARVSMDVFLSPFNTASADMNLLQGVGRAGPSSTGDFGPRDEFTAPRGLQGPMGSYFNVGEQLFLNLNQQYFQSQMFVEYFNVMMRILPSRRQGS